MSVDSDHLAYVTYDLHRSVVKTSKEMERETCQREEDAEDQENRKTEEREEQE